MKTNPEIEPKNSLAELSQIVRRLRDPNNGCPWDIEQTHKSLIAYLIEETYEVADAIRHGSKNDLKEELGDLLLQIFLHAEIANEEGTFCLNEVVESLNAKLIRRHPHVFGNIKLNWLISARKRNEINRHG